MSGPVAAGDAEGLPRRPLPGELLETHDGEGGLAGLARDCPRFVLRPRRYFIAWGGVLTLAFNGVPEQLRALKKGLEAALPGIPKENFGSKWPKVSIGCLRDGRTLTREELVALDRLCAEVSDAFDGHSGSGLSVDRLDLVLFACRSLERRLTTTTLWLKGPASGAQGEQNSGATQLYDTSVTDSVLAERLTNDYWDGVARPGNRESHYREPAWGATLVAPLEDGGPSLACRMQQSEEAFHKSEYEEAKRQERAEFIAHGVAMGALREQVDKLLPGAYAWFSTDSLHVTVRGLFG